MAPRAGRCLRPLVQQFQEPLKPMLPRFPVDLGPNADGIGLPFDSDAKEVIAFDFATVREGHS